MTTPAQFRTRAGDAGERIAEQLRAEITSGALSPGTRVRQEDLAERFGASRVPVREALRILGHEGLINTVANAGSWVTALTLAECEEIYQMRERLEPLLLSYSAPHLTSDNLDRMSELAHRISAASASGDIDTFLRLDRELHLASYAPAATMQLGDLIIKLWNSAAPYLRTYLKTWSPELRQIADEEHHLLIAALRDADFSEAERVLAAHIRRTRRHLERHPEIFAPAR